MSLIKEIIVVSNFPDESAEREDKKLAEALSAYSSTKLELLSDLSVENIRDTSVYLFRCIYDNSVGSVVKDMKPIYAHLHSKKIPYLTVYNGKGDQQGKRYLANLYAMGYPIVPTFTSPNEALYYPAEEYLIKPIFGGTGKGIRRILKKDMTHLDIDNTFVIQPRLEATFETSYLYIDDKFQFALKTRNDRWDLVVYEPTGDELGFVQKFVVWNPIKGIQRIDCLWTTGGTQYLLELEDWCPFLSLFDSENVPRKAFMANLFASLQSFDYDSLHI